jgi:hypothetical protein
LAARSARNLYGRVAANERDDEIIFQDRSCDPHASFGDHVLARIGAGDVDSRGRVREA